MKGLLEKSKRVPVVFQSSVESDEGTPKITSYFSFDPIIIDKSTGKNEEMEKAKKALLKKMRCDPEDNTLIIKSEDGQRLYEYRITGGVLFRTKLCCRYIKREDLLKEHINDPVVRTSNLVYKQNPVTGEFEETFKPNYLPLGPSESKEGPLEKIKFVFKKQEAPERKVFKSFDIDTSSLEISSSQEEELKRLEENSKVEITYNTEINQNFQNFNQEEDPLLEAFEEED